MDYVREHPDAAVLISLAAGTVVGLTIGAMLADSGGSNSWRSQRVAQGIGEKLLSSLERVVPDSVTSSLGLNR